MSIFDSPMFRNPNINPRRNIPGGIMASGPSLIRASQVVQPKTFGQTISEIGNIFSTASASPRSGIGQEREKKALENYQKSFGENEVPDATNLFKEEIENEARALDISVPELIEIKQRERELARMEEGDPGEGTGEPGFEQRTNLLEPFKKPKETQTPKNKVTFDVQSIKDSFSDVTNEIKNLYTEYNKDIDNLNTQRLFGRSMTEAVTNYRKALDTKPRELSFADVKDDVFDLLGYDRATLDENLSKDQQSAIWLNVMKAGLAVAAGESDNALTNVARGFAIGLDGYGRDIKAVKDDYRKDLEKYTTTAYTMLKDAKAEELAKNTLNLQRAAAEFKITSEFFGVERENLLNQLNREVALRNLKLNHLKAFAELDFEKTKFEVSQEKAEEANKLAFAKLLMMEEPLVTAARLDGYIELIDPEGLPTADNLRPTQKFKDSGKSLLDIFQKKNVQRTTDTEGNIRRYGKAPAFGITYLDGVDIPEATKEIVGQRIANLAAPGSAYNNALKDPLNGAPVALAAVIDAYSGLTDIEGVKIDFRKLNPLIQKEIMKGEGDAFEIFNNAKQFFIVDSIPNITAPLPE